MSWSDAQQVCEDHGMKLATFNTNALRYIINKHFKMVSSMGDVVYVGLKRNDQVICRDNVCLMQFMS